MELSQDLRAPSLREQVLQQVRSDIVSGRSPAGVVYSVPGLAAELGVSTTPVREALLELCRNGMLFAMRNRGFRVEPMSMEALDDLFTMRELIEHFALESLARRGLAEPAPLIALADAVADAVMRRNVPDYIGADRAFHEAILQAVGNPLMTKMAMQLRDDMRLYGIDSDEGWQRQQDSVQEHYQMIDRAVQQDVAGLGALISQHILAWKPLFRAALGKGPAAGA